MNAPFAEPLKRVVPLLQVNDVEETVAYWRDALGFQLDFAWPAETPKWAQVSRGGASFLFTMDLGTSNARFIAEKGNGVVFYVMVENIEAIYAELVAHEALIVEDVHEFGGRKQCSAADANGYVLTFSQEFAP